MMTINLYNVNYHFVTYSRKKVISVKLSCNVVQKWCDRDIVESCV